MSRASALSAAEVRDAAPLFAALGDRTRLRLVLRLCAGGPDSIAGLSAKAEVSRQWDDALGRLKRYVEG